MAKIERKSDKQTRRRILFLVVVFCVICFGAVIARLVYIQVLNRDFYLQKALTNQTRDVTIYPTRGTIYDTNGKPLAISASTEMLILNPRQLSPSKFSDLSKAEQEEYRLKKHIASDVKASDIELLDGDKADIKAGRTEAVAQVLEEVLELDRESVLEKAAKDSAYQVLRRGVEKDDADVIRAFAKENKLSGCLYFNDDSTRYYPYGRFLSHVLGCVGTDEQGLTGLEKQYEDVLTGTPGRSVTLADAHGNALTEDYETYYEPEEGQSIVLTVDEVIQHYLEKNLEIAYNDNKVEGSVIGVVMDVEDGGILAMASYPEFDPNDPFTLTDTALAEEISAMEDPEARTAARSEAIYAQWSNKPVSFMYYPGSTFKIITAASALEEGVVTEHTPFYCPGYKMVEGWGKPIHCWKAGGHGDEDLREALENSCNPALMTVGLALGKERFTQYVTAFGFRDKTGIDLPGEAVGMYNMSSNVDLAVYSFGQNFTITPLQLVTAVSAVANGGTLLQPHIVKEIRNADGTVAQTFGRTEVRQVISKETSDLMCDMLEDVVTYGTGKNSYVAGYRVAGKTGTTEKIAEMNKEGRDLYVTSFVAFAPADNPKIAVLILLDEPTVLPISGGLNTAPVVRRFLEEVLPYMEVDPIYTEQEQSSRSVLMPDLTGMSFSEAEAVLKKLGMSCASSGSASAVTDQVPAAGSVVASNTKAILYLGTLKPDKQVTVPDLHGMTLSAARNTLQGLGLYVHVSGGVSDGSQTVTKQDFAAQSTVAYGTVVTVETADMAQRAQ